MPTVPYSPVPEVAASGQGLPTLHPNIPIEAFGSEVASAINQAGKVVAGVGDAIFERGLWLQNQRNAAEAREAEADYITRSGLLSAEFNQLEGDAAIKAYPKYTQNLKALRESIKGNVTTVDGQRRFDEQSIGQLSRNIYGASAHLASQSKKYVIDSLDAKQQALEEDARRNSDDEATRERNLKEIRGINAERGKLLGKPPEVVELANRDAESRITTNWITKQSNEYPLTGPTLLENQYKAGKLNDADYMKLKSFVEGNRDSYGTSKIGTDLIAINMNEDGSLKKPLPEILADARRLGEEFATDDPKFAQKTVAAVESEFRRQQYSRKIVKDQNEQEIYRYLLEDPNIKSRFDFVQSERGLAIYNSLPPKKRAELDGIINRHISQRDQIDNDKSMLMLKGLLDRDRDAFLDIDPTDPKLKLSYKNKQTVLDWQKKALASYDKDPGFQKYMNMLRGSFGSELRALGVYSLTPSNQEDYDHFTGATMTVIEQWRHEHKKMPSDREFKEQIAPTLLQNKPQTWTNFFFAPLPGISREQTDVFRHDTSSKQYQAFSQKFRDDTLAAGDAAPTEDEIYRMYSRKIFNDLYKARKEKPGGKP